MHPPREPARPAGRVCTAESAYQEILLNPAISVQNSPPGICTTVGFTRTLLGQSDSAKVNPNNSLKLPDRYLTWFLVCNKPPGRYLAGFWGRLLTGCQCLQVDYTDKKSHPRRSKKCTRVSENRTLKNLVKYSALVLLLDLAAKRAWYTRVHSREEPL